MDTLFEQMIYDRLHATIEGTPLEPDKKALDEFGKLIQLWRLMHGYSRSDLAARLTMTVTQLFCIENGIANVDDITTAQLQGLKTLLTS